MTRRQLTALDANDVPPADFGSITAAAEANLWTPSLWTPIPANDPVPGRTYEVQAGGTYTVDGFPPTFTFRMRAGQSSTPANNVALDTTAPTSTVGTNQTNLPWWLTFAFTFRTVGTAGTGTGNGTLRWGVSQRALGGVVATVDTTVDGGLVFSIAGSNATNGFTCSWVALRSYN